ncbi:c-type cytochrome domain-containing protein [Neolewinella antarctica]|uniref:Membrane protein n=1 Tax=Neolewinella antarctica TaxID=442734 RepID=A0ABX0X7L0_9BACT|nr:c-type cytochrome domain-containing protein [Neolewinella antarctica]NJC25196.1 putative membrane protein [Neolewinella antarctica]
MHLSQLFLADFPLFVGRFHPLVVHLPIGFLLMAALLEWWPGEKVRLAVRAAWAVGAASAVAAAGCGWLLAMESGGGDTLFWHRWLGVSVAVLAIFGVFVTNRGGALAKGYGVLVVVLLSLAGHQGGNLTHGEDYLFQHAPPIVQQLAGHAPESMALVDWESNDLDSINLYQQFLRPAISSSCAKCHNGQKQNGGLRMDEPRFALAGGDSGPLFSAGEPLRSNWLKRVTLPRENVKAMPPGGTPWSFTQISLLRYWIDQGADTLFVLDPANTPADLKTLLLRDYGLDLRPRLFVERIKVPRLTPAVEEELVALNWQLSALQPDGGALEAKPMANKSITAEALARLAEVATDQLVYLSLDHQPLGDAELEPLVRFPNLNRLRLNGTNLTASTVEKLTGLRHLESLNVYGTELDDASFEHLQRFPSLKRLYLWQTNVSPAGAAAFASDNPQIYVETGYGAGTAAKDAAKK